MKPSRNFINITLADFIVRAAYQMGKTPLLPIFAAALGASDVLLGSIVSISTLTGMVTKPLFGVLSDRQGRKWWLILGTLFFAFVPFLYRFINTPGQLVLIRVIHGTATAIYGPVTVAYVAERGGKRKAESLGWFAMARNGGYIVGPALAGWLLLSLDPATVFTVIGLISCVAFVPVLMLSDHQPSTANHTIHHSPFTIHHFLTASLRASALTPSVWLSGGLEAVVYVGLYAAKAFLPIYALTAGYNTAQIGLFFSAQESVHLLLEPFGGRLGDRDRLLSGDCLGHGGMALALPLLTLVNGFPALLLWRGSSA